MCSQVSSISATCCKKLNLMNILQHCPSDFVAESVPGYTCNILVSQALQHQKEVCVASASKNVPRVAAAL